MSILTLTPDEPEAPTRDNAAAIAWVEAWYATPDDQPPGYWEALEELLRTHPITFGALGVDAHLGEGLDTQELEEFCGEEFP